MKRFAKSIRWRMQAWHGLLLLVVLLGFGITACRLEWSSEMQRVDSELQQHMNVLLSMMERPENRPHGRPGRGGLSPEDLFSGLPPLDRPPRPIEPDLPPEIQDWLQFDTKQEPFLTLWAPHGEIIVERGPLAKELAMPARGSQRPLTPEGQTHWLTPSGEIVRAVVEFNPNDECLVVGRSVQPELQWIQTQAWKLAGVTGGVWLLGLLIGHWITGRALRPIQKITATASSMSAGSLDQRINVEETDSELGQMATVLNETFGRLQHSFEQQAQFTADAAHELRTPVSVVLSEAQFALSRDRNAGEYRQSLEACQRAAKRMHSLTESLLELSRLEAGAGAIKLAPLDLASLMQESMELIFPLAEPKDITLDATLDHAPCQGDVVKLSQVLANLITNAVQYSPEGTTIHLSTGVTDGYAYAQVRDEGVGIPADHLTHLFDRFYRVDASRNRNTGGAGLGLAICKAIVDAHHGLLPVTSTVGEGTTFTLKLQAMEE